MPKNLLTRLMRGAASFQFAGKPISFISTHAPHARRDVEWAITAYNAGTAKADFNREVGVTSEYTESVLILRGEIINAT